MKFWPGQRIKKVRGSLATGVEAIFVGPAVDPEGDPEFDMLVTILEPTIAGVTLFGAWTIRTTAEAGETLLAISHNWEPAIPPGLESIEEAGELWRTEAGECVS